MQLPATRDQRPGPKVRLLLYPFYALVQFTNYEIQLPTSKTRAISTSLMTASNFLQGSIAFSYRTRSLVTRCTAVQKRDGSHEVICASDGGPTN
jgi:hypothetical protein